MKNHTARVAYSLINSIFTMVYHFSVYNTAQTNGKLFYQLLIMSQLQVCVSIRAAYMKYMELDDIDSS